MRENGTIKKERDGEIREKWDNEIWRVLGSKRISH
jgi:hypothetical protein